MPTKIQAGLKHHQSLYHEAVVNTCHLALLLPSISMDFLPFTWQRSSTDTNFTELPYATGHLSTKLLNFSVVQSNTGYLHRVLFRINSWWPAGPIIKRLSEHALTFSNRLDNNELIFKQDVSAKATSINDVLSEY